MSALRLLRDDDVLDAAAALHGRNDVVDVVARAAWSVFTEPGDGVAGALIAELGAVEALRVALDDGAVDSVTSGSPTARHALEDARARWRPRSEPAAVAMALRAAAHVEARLLVPGDAEWPTSVDDLAHHAPHVLWVRGDAALFGRSPSVAIVGARASSAYGDLVASELAGDLAATGAVVVSGGAYGIDGAAHRAALGVEGKTIAVLAGGVDRAYPSGHRELLFRIATRGAVVSELPCGAAPTKWRFLSRNRLIAALGRATVVVEAGWRSGSLNTAGHAAALGRPLGAVPGPVTSASSAGCHRLLREYDARCVTSAADVRELWGFDSTPEASIHSADPDETRLLDALSSRAAHGVEELSRRSGLSPARVSAQLGLLELEGRVARRGEGWKGVTPS